MTDGLQEPLPGYGDPSGTGRPQYDEPWSMAEQPYPQQPYGQQQYIPPPGGYAPPPAAATPYMRPQRQRAFGIVGFVLATIGAVAVLLAFLVFRWYRSSANDPVFRGADTSKFSEIHQQLTQFQNLPGEIQNPRSASPPSRYIDLGVAPAYFSWLGWLLFGIAAGCALLAVLPFAGSVIFRVLGLLVGLAAVGFTLWAINLVRVTGPIARQLGGRAPGYGDWIRHTFVGPWLAIGGFLFLAIAAATGPSHKYK